MRAGTKVAAYVAGLAVAFVGALGVGALTGSPISEPAPHGGHPGEDHQASGHAHTDRDTAPAPGAEAYPAGLQIAAAGYLLSPVEAPESAGEPGTLRFQIVGPEGEPVTEFNESHEQRMHLIVVRSDTDHYRHVHPDLAADGTWVVDWRWPAAGTYKVFADFEPTALGSGLTLSRTVEVAGDYQPSPPPALAAVAEVGEFTVLLEGDLRAGEGSTVTAGIERDGQPVTDLQPYLGALGHLVALREGDLAYIHVHPEHEHEHDHAPAEIAFHIEAPTVGTYRLFLEFQVAGQVHTAEFTVTASEASEGVAG